MKPNRITIHCSATPNGQHVDIEVIRQDHIKNRGFTDIGYHLLCQPSGEMQSGRPLNQVGAHVEGHNTGNLGVCLVGTDKFTRQQFKALESTLDSWFMVFSIPLWEIWCHHQFDTAIKQGKTCPNLPIQNLFAWYHLKMDKAIESYLLR